MVENTNPRFAERQLAELVASHPGETVYTDSNTERHASYFLRFKNVNRNQVSHAMPGPNALVFYNQEAMMRCARTFRCDEKLDVYLPKTDWRPIQTLEAPRSPLARLVEALSLQRVLPAEIARKITRPVAPIVVYRVPGPPAETR